MKGTIDDFLPWIEIPRLSWEMQESLRRLAAERGEPENVICLRAIHEFLEAYPQMSEEEKAAISSECDELDAQIKIEEEVEKLIEQSGNEEDQTLK